MSIDEYKRLWDGSEPGWTLQRFDLIEWSISFHFADAGPSKSDILALRQLISDLRDAPLTEVLTQLRGLTVYTLPAEVGNLEMRSLMDAAGQLGLDASAAKIGHSGYLPISADGNALVIEDDDLSAEVAQRMIAAGVAVTEVHVD